MSGTCPECGAVQCICDEIEHDRKLIDAMERDIERRAARLAAAEAALEWMDLFIVPTFGMTLREQLRAAIDAAGGTP